MPTARFSVHCVARGVLSLCAFAVLASAPARAQTLSIADSPIAGTRVGGAALFPAAALERLGFRLAADGATLRAMVGSDTLRFWATSPFFRRGARTYQLTHAASLVGDALHLPEQLFIQWLPAAYPDRFEFRSGALQLKQAVAAEPVAASAAGATPAPATPARSTASRTRVVIIDPGHGGRDPGKVGPNGLREKDVALMISQRLAAMLKDRGYEVHLTRTTDTLIALGDRPKLANRWRGDRPVAVFVSIHANSVVATSAKGFETFFLSEARTEDERRVAEMENEAVKFEERRAGPASTGLEQVLNGLMSDFLLRASNDLASTVQTRLATFHPGPNRGVKRAGFLVLVGSIMPAVLVETAFISNPEEAGLLGTQSFQQKIAFGIADALDEFFRRNEHLWVQQ